MPFEDFWPRYLRAHSDPRTRAMHVAGTLLGTGFVVAGLVLRKPWVAGIGLVAGYTPAWVSHAFIEHNNPESFRAPIASLRADFVMAWHVLRGTIDEQYAKIT
ncbi:MAG TPA: DUF962 domain-containing protein [Candidatus Tyrphobacter sp.]